MILTLSSFPVTEELFKNIDDAVTIHVRWDCGSNLGLAYGEDTCRKLTETEITDENNRRRVFICIGYFFRIYNIR